MSSYEGYNYSDEEEEDPYIGNYPDEPTDFQEEEAEEEEDRHEEEEDLSEYS